MELISDIENSVEAVYVRMAPTLFSAPLALCKFREVTFREEKNYTQTVEKSTFSKSLLISKKNLGYSSLCMENFSHMFD